MTPDLETRIISWVSGEASGAEAAELERLAVARPEVARFRSRVEAIRELAQEAVAPDREPMRLSGDRRAELMATFNAVRRRNLALAASFSLLLVAGIAWYGEITHYIPPIHRRQAYVPDKPFEIKQEPPERELENHEARSTNPDIEMPHLQEQPVQPTGPDFVVPMEIPRPAVDLTIAKISQDGGRAIGDHSFNPSQLDVQAAVMYRARPIYPEGMRRQGITGDATVDFIVDPSGRVQNATAVHSSRQEFEQPACDAVRKWTFKPGRKDGRAVYVHMQVPIVFTLDP